MAITTGRTGNWATVRGTLSEVRSHLNNDKVKTEDVKAMLSTGSDIKVLYWKPEPE